MVVLDEAHRIKNIEDGIQSFAALKLATYAKSRVVLTGTPAPNSYIDLINLYKFIWPANNIIGYTAAQLNNMSKNPDDPRINDLTNRIAPFFIRIKKQDLQLPNATFHEPELIDMSPIQKIIYEDIARNSVKKMEQNINDYIFNRSAVIRLRQAATNPNLLNKPLDDYFDQLDGDFYNKSSLDNTLQVSSDVLPLIRDYSNKEVPQKFIKAAELAKRIIRNNGKLLIWCEFIGTCNDLHNYLNECGIVNKLLYGATPKDERKDIIHSFGNPLNFRFSVIIANPHAVGESISLHKGCHNALYLEQSFNAGTYMQSKDRIHRVGLSKDQETNYYFFQSKDTTDEVIYMRVMEKETKMLDVIEKQEIPLIAANRDFMDDTNDDFKSIIRDYYERGK